ncbi:MAG: CCA tRNA nucleotidyltransferase [Methanopyri archaeon]|nr:CCA tRNA nucleotidyltransferase [Methanopyri archaeon]
MEAKTIIDRVLPLVKPDPEERDAVTKAAETVRREVENELKEVAPEARVELIGSIARDTWLPGTSDADVFCVFPRDVDLDEIVEVTLKVGSRVIRRLGGEPREDYAHHPYVTGKVKVDGVPLEVDIVPCYDSPPDDPKTPVDRTPHHNRYVLENLEDPDEVRLLKAFLKTIRAYGAEARVKGFSGYLCEVLVIHYGSFLDVLKSAADVWRPGYVVDPRGFVGDVYEDHDEVREKFEDQNPALIVLDPVDPDRNVAAALSRRQLARFVVAARMFLERPTEGAFIPRKPQRLAAYEVIGVAETGHLVGLEVVLPDAPEDVYWPQLEKTARSTVKRLEDAGFRVRRWTVHAEEDRGLGYVLIETEERELAPEEWRAGPEGWAQPERTTGFADAHGKFWFDEDGRMRARVKRNALKVEDVLSGLEGADEHFLLSWGFGKDIAKASTGEVKVLKAEDVASLVLELEPSPELDEFFRGDVISRLFA